MSFGIKSKFEEIDRSIRGLERRMMKEELRTKQLLVMFKMILEKSYNAKRSNKKILMKDILEYMDRLVNANLTQDEIAHKPDLIEELVRKGLQ